MENRFLKKTWIIGIIVLFIGASVVAGGIDSNSSVSEPITRGWLHVGGSGSGNYTTIQSAINNASSGDTIFVFNGTYYENVFLGDYKENITLIGEDKENTIIDGMNTPDADTFFGNCNYFTISGFTFRNASRYGLYAWSWSSGHNIIRNNIFIGNNQTGLVVYQGDNSIISGNSFSNSQWGFYLGRSKYCSITNNYFSFNNKNLYLLDRSFYNKICNNVFTNNYLGIDIDASDCNIIYHNNFISNQINAQDDGHNFWNNNGQGNYWSNYTGPDDDNDDIGDVPYNIPNNGNQDNYPLMHPFENYINMNISLSNSIVPEMSEFTVTVMTLLNKPIQAAIVRFNNQTEYTDTTGKVTFVAPNVEEDTVIDIAVSKEGFINNSCLTTVKNIPVKLTFIFGKLTKLTSKGEYFTFEAVKTRMIILYPFSFNTYLSGEQFIISKDYRGLVGARYIFALCEILV